ncbi:F-box protein [Striga hermonthica]|uniref:F-box protein n=1 Tax=Striga hermonthica TaxID=68872 RepID=A0A9N7NBY4_STRHE|nr:F-box protein [Striga hermonthica]
MGEFSSILEKKTKKKEMLQSRDDLTCWQRYHLVVAREDLLVVTQHIMLSVDSDGLYVDFDSDDSERPAFELPTVTIDFDVHRYDWEDGDLKYVEGSSLGGWALFFGASSHSVALRASDFPELKPNSIYFTDALELSLNQGNHDIGIFSYMDKTVSPCYYPCDPADLKPIFPAPIWFFPTSF